MADVNLFLKAPNSLQPDTPISTATPLPVTLQSQAASVTIDIVRLRGAANLSTNQIAVTSVQTTLSAARTARRSITIKNLDASLSGWVGESPTSISTGMELKAGESWSVDFTGLVVGVAANTAIRMAVSENYDS